LHRNKRQKGDPPNTPPPAGQEATPPPPPPTHLQAELIKHVCYKKQNSIMPLDFKTGMKSEEFW